MKKISSIHIRSKVLQHIIQKNEQVPQLTNCAVVQPVLFWGQLATTAEEILALVKKES